MAKKKRKATSKKTTKKATKKSTKSTKSKKKAAAKKKSSVKKKKTAKSTKKVQKKKLQPKKKVYKPKTTPPIKVEIEEIKKSIPVKPVTHFLGKKWVKWVLVAIVLLILVYLSSSYGLQDDTQGNTFEDSVILNTPPQRQADSMDAFLYVNTLRQGHDKSVLDWDNDIYQLAVARSKDMYERDYFDHVTPEGLCVNSMKEGYDLEDFTLAENLGAMFEGYDDDNLQYSLSLDVKGQVDVWMQSRGHRYNLLYDDHVSGAIGCYFGVCTFIGAHPGEFGLGAGPCVNGEQGQEFWESAGEQKGEV